MTPRIDALLDQFAFAETIQHKCAVTGVTLTLAEWHPVRNKALGKAFAETMSKRQDLDKPLDELTLSHEEQVRLFCDGCLRGWDLVDEKGKPVPIETASEMLLTRSGDDDTRAEAMLQAWLFPTRLAANFKAAYGKKKPSPKPGTSKSSTATSRTPSRRKPKPAAKPSRKR